MKTSTIEALAVLCLTSGLVAIGIAIIIRINTIDYYGIILGGIQ